MILLVKMATNAYSLPVSFSGRSSLLSSSSGSFQNSSSRQRRQQALHQLRLYRQKQSKRKVRLTLVLSVLLVSILSPSPRRLWVKPRYSPVVTCCGINSVCLYYRSMEWWNRIVPSFTDDDWLENFRLSKTTFYYLCEKLRPVIKRQIRKCDWLSVWNIGLRLLYGVLLRAASTEPSAIYLE